MSATETVPASCAPSPWSSPGFRATKVTVRTAADGDPDASPVSPATPEGMSTASTGVPAGTGGNRNSPRKPVPKAASTTRSAGPMVAPDPASTTVTRAPRRRRRSAATRPSAPLFPGPATTTTRRP